MATSNKTLDEAIRKEFMEKVIAFFKENGEPDVYVTKSNEIAIPTLNAERNEKYIVITFKVPTGTRDGEAYDGHAEAKDYERALAEKAEKAKKAAEAKAKKIAKDKAEREAKAKAKAEAEG